LLFITFGEILSIAFNNLLDDIFNISFAGESLIIDVFLNLLIDDIVLNVKIGFHKLFQ